MDFINKHKYKLIFSCIGLILIVVAATILLLNTKELPFINDEPKSKIELNSVNSWIYAPKFTDNFDLQRIAESGYEVAVIRPNYKGRTIKSNELEFLRSDNNKLIFADINIISTDSDRISWKREWNNELPSWIKEDKNVYYVDFWNEEWKTQIYGKQFSEVDNAIKAGFDGIYINTSGMKNIDKSKQKDLIKGIKDIIEYSNKKDSNLQIVVSNIADFDQDYFDDVKNSIDGISQEGLIYGYDKSGTLTSQNKSGNLKSRLDKYRSAGKAVFILDLPFACENESEDCYDTENLKRIRNSYSTISDYGYIPYDTNAGFNGLTYSPPQAQNLEVEISTIPIFKWKHHSFNWNHNQSAYRLFVSSTKAKLEKDDPDIYDSGKIWTNETIHGFVPGKEVKDGKYFWKVVTYEAHGNTQLVGEWSDISEFNYTKPAIDNNSDIQAKQTAWIPDWAFDKGFESFKENYTKFDSISPVWYDLNSDGTLKSLTHTDNEEFISFTKDKDIDLIPTIASFDPGEISAPLNEYRDEHIENILKVVEEGGYDGIDLDYEATYEKDKKEYEIFIKELSQKLHDKDKLLVVTVLSKWTDAEVYTGLQETRRVQDWKMIGEYADEVRIMAYDWTYQSSYVAGPISPYNWDEAILQYALEKVPAEKIVLALPLYSYSFKIDDQSNISRDIFSGGETYGSERRIYAYTHEEIVELDELEEVEFEIEVDNFSKEKIFKYFDGTFDRVMYFNDYQSIQAKRELTEKYGVKGVAYWRLGGDDARNY